MKTPADTLFHFRPMVSMALGLCAGLLLNGILSGTRLIMALCLFALFFASAMRFSLRPQAAFAAGCLAGLMRPLFGIISLPPAVLAPLEYMRCVLLNETARLFGDQAPLLQAMLWGSKSGISEPVYAAFRGSGIAHVLALSGLHVSFVTAIIAYMTRASRPKIRFATAATLLFAYCAIAAFPASLIRASIMSLCSLYASVSGRRYDMPSGIGLAAVIILLADPTALSDVGFQLSFGAVIAIALLMSNINRLLSFLPKEISDLLSVSACGTLGTLPLSVYHFNTLPILSLFANMLILPLVPVAFVSALLICLLGVCIHPLAATLSSLPMLLMRIITGAAGTISSLSFAVKHAAVTPAACIFIYLAYFCLSDYPLISKQQKYASAAAMFAGAALCMI